VDTVLALVLVVLLPVPLDLFKIQIMNQNVYHIALTGKGFIIRMFVLPAPLVSIVLTVIALPVPLEPFVVIQE